MFIKREVTEHGVTGLRTVVLKMDMLLKLCSKCLFVHTD